MNQYQSLLVVLCVLVPAGCGESYDQAMRRLVAEQKQLDRIDQQIKEIEAERDKGIGEWDDRVLKLSAMASTGDPFASKELGGMIERQLQETKRLSELADRKTTPLYEEYARQRDRVDSARKAADEAQ